MAARIVSRAIFERLFRFKNFFAFLTILLSELRPKRRETSSVGQWPPGVIRNSGDCHRRGHLLQLLAALAEAGLRCN